MSTIRGTRPSPMLLVALAVAATWLLSGVPFRSGALFVGYELAYVLLPGCLLYVLLSPAPGDRLRVVTIGWPLGYALEIGAYALAAALHARDDFVFLPLAAVALMGPPVIRRYGLRRMGRTIMERAHRRGRGDGVVVAELLARREVMALSVAITAAMVVLALTFFAAYPLPGHAHSIVYYVDNVWDISVASEVRNHWPITEPYVAAGHSLLHYYYGVFIHIAAVNQVTGVALSTTVLRLLPSTVIVVASLQLWSLGRALGRSRWVGPIAVVLLLVVEDVNLDPMRPGAFGTEFFKVIPTSPTMALGIVFFLGLLALIQSWLSLEGAAEPATRYGGFGSVSGVVGWLAMVGILVLGASLVKATATADFIGGLTLFWLWRAFTRGAIQLLSYCLALSAICAATIYFLVFHGASPDALHLSLLDFVSTTNFRAILNSHSALRIIPLVGIAMLACLFTLAPLLGACSLLWRRDAVSSYVAFSIAVFAVSLVAYLTLGGTGGGEGYFLSFGYVALAPVAAEGLILLWEDATPMARRTITRACGVILVLGLLAATSTLGLEDKKGIELDAWYAVAYGLLVGAVTIAAFRLEKLLAPTISSRAARLLACCIPMLGVLGFVKPLSAAVPNAWKVVSHGRISSVNSRQDQGMTAALYNGLIWVREHTESCDMLAVNNHTIKADSTKATASRYFYYSAFTERRVFLESWDFSPIRMRSGRAFRARLALNELATVHGNPTALRELRRQGVRYVLIDRTHGGGASEPASVSTLVFANSALDVYRLLGTGDTPSGGEGCDFAT